MKSYVVYSELTFKVLWRVQAHDLKHAETKVAAIYGTLPEFHGILSHAEYQDTMNLALESLGLAPWQKSLTRQTPKSVFGF